MPALSSTMTEGKIVSWLKSPGDKVKKGESIVVVESGEYITVTPWIMHRYHRRNAIALGRNLAALSISPRNLSCGMQTRPTWMSSPSARASWVPSSPGRARWLVWATPSPTSPRLRQTLKPPRPRLAVRCSPLLAFFCTPILDVKTQSEPKLYASSLQAPLPPLPPLLLPLLRPPLPPLRPLRPLPLRLPRLLLPLPLLPWPLPPLCPSPALTAA